MLSPHPRFKSFKDKPPTGGGSFEPLFVGGKYFHDLLEQFCVLFLSRIFLESATSLGRERHFEGNGLVDLMPAIQSV
jgi:hypothetical protein